MPGAVAGTGGNVLTRKIGPLPAWAWTAVASGLVLLVVVLEYRKSSAGSTASTTAGNVTPPTVFTFPPEQDGASGDDDDGDDDDDGKKKAKPKPPRMHPGAFRVKKGENPPTTRHGDRVWVHGHYGPKGAYHKGHWSGSGKVPQPRRGG